VTHASRFLREHGQVSAEARPDRETKARPGPESDCSSEGGRISAKGPPKSDHPVREAEIVALFARQ